MSDAGLNFIDGDFITIMVTLAIISAYNTSPPAAIRDGRCKINNGGPLYLLADVKAVALLNKLIFVTSKCRHDTQRLGIDTKNACEFILELTNACYKDSEWCSNGKGAIAACDAYTLVRYERREGSGEMGHTEYYLKFAIGKNGDVLLMVSCHLS